MEAPKLREQLEKLSPATRSRALQDPHLMSNLRRLHGQDGVHAILQSAGGGYPNLERVSMRSQERIANDPHLMSNLRRLYGADGIHAILQANDGGYPNLERRSGSGRVLTEEEVRAKMSNEDLERFYGRDIAQHYIRERTGI